MKETEYEQHRDNYDGWCTNCDTIGRVGGTEPDARKYPCEGCEKNTVYGMDEAFMMGLINIDFGE